MREEGAKKQIARPVIGVARFNVPIMEIGHLHVKENLKVMLSVRKYH